MSKHITDAILATPPVASGVIVIMGLSLSTWAAIAGIIYTLILIAIKLPALARSLRTLVRWTRNRRIDDVEGN